jgi:hypothetical protein
MGYQGTRRAASPGTGAQRVVRAGTGAQPVAGSGTGAQPVIGPGSGAQPVAESGTGAQPVAGSGTGTQPVIGPGSGAQPVAGGGTGAQPVMRAGTGTQPVMRAGTGAHRVMRARTGAQPTLARTPVRGFPPAPPGRAQAPDAFTPWSPAAAPPAGEDDGYANGTGHADGPGYADGPAAADGPGCADGPGHADEDANGHHPADEPDAAAPAAPATRRRGPGTARPRRRFSRLAWLAAVCVVVAAGGFAGYKYLYEPRVNAPVSPTLRLPTTTPQSPDFDQALGEWQHIGTRAEDPDPLTLTELYPLRFQLDGGSYTRTAASATKNCTQVVFGSQLQDALQAGNCTQVLRASYISGDGTMMGTIGVVNLEASAAAQKAGEVTGPQQLIAPLAAQKGPTSKLGNGTGVVQAEIKGHYLILMWAEFADLKSPSTSAQKKQLEQFATDLVTGSANIDLSTRMLTGKA